jgi:Xaa-Pro aminopeptidase
MSQSSAILIYGDTERCADALYFGRVGVPDAFVALHARGKKYAIVSALEFTRVKRDSDFDVVLPLEHYMTLARKTWPNKPVGAAEVIVLLCRELNQRHIVVGSEFPAGLYSKLCQRGLKPTIAEGHLFPSRETKSPKEAEQLRLGNACSAAGIAAAQEALRQSKIKGRKIIYQGKELTSERLRMVVEKACLENGGVSINTIVAGGDQACDPHHRGSGPIRPNELIIVDVFPRLTASGYYGDMTRTFLKGKASDQQHKLVMAVKEAQKNAIATVKAGVAGKVVHQAVLDVFEKHKFETTTDKHGSKGFFHGTGHGLGLEVHESPRMNKIAELPLKLGTVVTVEPGLYYPGIGGCRFEDVVQVTHSKPRMLSKAPYNWEIK